MMASAKGDKLTDLAASIQKQEEFLIYDIRGDLSSDDVLAAFSGFNVPYKFMSLSGRRFFIVVMKDSSDHTQYASLSFPGASQVDVYPAEHLGDFYEYAGAENLHDKSVITFPDDNLILTEFTILDRGRYY
nr:hypothetical protein BaRGS_033776 [Batillaria attramentaria]